MDNLEAFITLIKYFILGFIQGFTEPIPISSSGHVVILRELFNLQVAGLSFEIIVHFGSLLAICFIYKNDIYRLIVNGFYYLRDKDEKFRADFQFILYLLIATLLTGFLGLVFEDYIIHNLTSMKIIGFSLILTGISLWIIRNLQGNKSDAELTLKDAVIIGIAQATALIPGISRSGMTIVAAMLLGMKKEVALRFSFLLFIPVSLGITILSIQDIINDPNFNSLLIPYLIAFITATTATFYSLKWFVNIMLKGKLIYFSLYCFIAGILIISLFNVT